MRLLVFRSQPKKRKTITTDIELEAIGMVEKDIMLRNGEIPDIIIVANEGWHEGVLGIIAGRLKEKYNRPSCVISFKGKTGKGSARSTKDISIGGDFYLSTDSIGGRAGLADPIASS